MKKSYIDLIFFIVTLEQKREESMIDRAYAHYRWADRYRRRSNRAKSKRHLDRGDYYARCWALRTRPSFGVDENDKLGTKLLVLKHIEQIGEKKGQIGEIGQIDPDGKLAWFLPASDIIYTAPVTMLL